MAVALFTTMTSFAVVLPPASLVICTRNRPALLHDTLASVLAGNQVPPEIVVVDQSDFQDGDAAAFRHPACEVRYHHSRTIGVSRARNTAISLARHDIVALLDDDMLVPQDWYESLIKALAAHGPQIIVTGRVMPHVEGPDGFVPTTITSLTPQTYAGRIFSDHLASGHMAMYRSAFEQIGPFDERLGPGTHFPGAEDADFGYRAMLAGYAIQYVPDAVVYHRAWRRNRDYWRLRWNYGRGQGSYYAKHFSLNDRHMLRRMVDDVGRHIAPLPRKLISRPWWAMADLVHAGALLSGAGEWLLRYSRR